MKSSLGTFKKHRILRKTSALPNVSEKMQFLVKYFSGYHELDYYLINIREDKTTVYADISLKPNGTIIRYLNYPLDEKNMALSHFTKLLAEYLREVVDKNVFFDIRNGRLYLVL